MRTKTLLLTAALTVATAATSMAQVFSANVVGYVNVTVPANSYAIVSTPLEFTGTGGNNITNVIGGTIPDGTVVLPFANGTFQDSETYFDGFGWFPGTTDLPPGGAYFVKTPQSPAVPANLTFVGEVLLGARTNALALGFNLVGSKVPQALPLGDSTTSEATTLHFPASDGDNILIFDVATQGYKDAITYFDGYGWFDSGPGGPGPVQGPTPAVAQGFFVEKKVAGNWVRTFNVNP